ncbi:hypothetical protein LTR93_011688 [Exophiala xenobiotica]|nr:hypothetical protein LTR93_011688 [Exophiala xenobiotica]
MAVPSAAHHQIDHYNPVAMEHQKGRQYRWYNVIVVIMMSLGATATYGYTSNVVGMTLAQPTFIVYMGLDTAPNATDLMGLCTSLFVAGGVAGLVFSAWSSDYLGRKRTIQILGAMSLIGCVLTTAAQSIGMFFAGRAMAGIGGWGLLCVVSMWIGEVAAPTVRGVLMYINMGIMALCGYVGSAGIGYGFFHLQTTNWSWRGPLIFQFIWPSILFCTIWVLPESPRWLMQNNHHAEAQTVLNRLHQPEEARIESIQITQAIELQKSLPSSWFSLISKTSYRKRTFLAIYVCFAGQMMATFALAQYSPIIYASLGYDTDKVFQYSLGFITYGSGMLCLGGLFVDKLPRHIMMSIGLLGTAFSLAIAAALIAIFTTPEALANPNSSALQAAVAFIYITLTWYQMFYEPVQFAFLAEIFPTQLRAKGPIAFQKIGWKFYLCFIIPSFICGVITLLMVPNTLKIPLEEVNKLFGDYDEIAGRLDVGAAPAHENEKDSDISVIADNHVEKIV